MLWRRCILVWFTPTTTDRKKHWNHTWLGWSEYNPLMFCQRVDERLQFFLTSHTPCWSFYETIGSWLDEDTCNCCHQNNAWKDSSPNFSRLLQLYNIMISRLTANRCVCHCPSSHYCFEGYALCKASNDVVLALCKCSILSGVVINR